LCRKGNPEMGKTGRWVKKGRHEDNMIVKGGRGRHKDNIIMDAEEGVKTGQKKPAKRHWAGGFDFDTGV